MRAALDRLRDARDYARAAQDNALGLSPDILAEAKQPLHAALYDLIVIGEALGKVPEDIPSLAPEIPWATIVAMRNHLVHSYWQIDLEIVYDVVQNRLDPLIAAIERLTHLVHKGEP